MEKRIAVIIHQKEFFSFANFLFKPKMAATIANSPLVRAMVIATIPRVRHPRTSTGVNALIKNAKEIIRGNIICLSNRLVIGGMQQYTYQT